MIPLVIPPLSNLRVLVTRPAHQATSLCNAITKLKGEVIKFPILEIKARDVAVIGKQFDLAIFVSANAVVHGAGLINAMIDKPQIAAIGMATTSELKAAGFDVTITAPPPFNSEALLCLESMLSPPKSVLLIKGAGGRELLRETLISRGSSVETADVYERVAVTMDDKSRGSLYQAFGDGLIDVITVTSMDIAEAFASLVDQPALALAQACAVLAGSKRIAEQLPPLGWRGPIIVSNSPDDDSMLDALTRWYARSRA